MSHFDINHKMITGSESELKRKVYSTVNNTNRSTRRALLGWISCQNNWWKGTIDAISLFLKVTWSRVHNLSDLGEVKSDNQDKKKNIYSYKVL